MTDEPLTYRFGPVERRGILGQLRAGQAAVVAAGAVVAIVVLDRVPTPAGAFVGMLGIGASLAVAFAPIARRTPEEWAPIAVSFALRALLGRLRFRSGAPPPRPASRPQGRSDPRRPVPGQRARRARRTA